MSTISAPEEQKILETVPKQLYIDGEWRDGSKGTFSVEDPATGEPLVDVADASEDDAKAALDAPPRPARNGPPTRRASAARSCAARSRRSSRAPTSWRC